ncbi:MAG: hypothetical protein BGN92_12600 [Sphingobacteriales bacterium 41-5]|nr:MAG: hypothetical protein BGN92_12600 [Sphingobacteriales bacterium 41-5]
MLPDFKTQKPDKKATAGFSNGLRNYNLLPLVTHKKCVILIKQNKFQNFTLILADNFQKKLICPKLS